MRSDFNTRKLCILAVLSALSVCLSLFVHFPIFPAAPYLEFDPGDVAILTGTFLYGSVAGVVMTLITSLVQGFTVSATSGIWGIVMHFVSTSFFCVVANFLYRRRATIGMSAWGLGIGAVLTTALMVPLNLLITPLYTNAPVSFVASLLVPTIIPFNLIKFSLNAALSFVLWRSVRAILIRFWGESDVA